jgi:hypothetical protein
MSLEERLLGPQGKEVREMNVASEMVSHQICSGTVQAFPEWSLALSTYSIRLKICSMLTNYLTASDPQHSTNRR